MFVNRLANGRYQDHSIKRGSWSKSRYDDQSELGVESLQKARVFTTKHSARGALVQNNLEGEIVEVTIQLKED